MKKSFFSILVASFLFLAFMQPTHSSAASKFGDVSESYWAYQEIQYLVDQDIIHGYKNGNFGAKDSIKRVQAAIMLVKALGLDTTNRPDPGFKDVKKGDSYYDIIATVADEGILQGNNGYFNPNKSLTRAQMAKILTDAYQLSYVYDSSFSDVPKDHWAYKYVNCLIGNGITAGYSDNTFRPNQTVDRTQFAVFMARVLNDEFKPGIKIDLGKATYQWADDGSLIFNTTITNKLPTTLKNMEIDVLIKDLNDQVIAEKHFDLGTDFVLQPGETKPISFTFENNTVSNKVDLDQGFYLFYNMSYNN